MNEPTNALLLLSDAFLDWCDLQFVEEIKKQERLCSAKQLKYQDFPRLVPDDELRQPTDDDRAADQNPAVGKRKDAWNELGYNFRHRMQAGELHLSGVLVKPELTTRPRPIPSAWAFEIELDLCAEAVTMAGRRFADVRVSKQAPVAAVTSPARSAGRLPPITQENLRDLTDDEVLLLLKDHAERVVRSEDGMLIPPGQVTLLPIIRTMMRRRSAEGDLLPSLKAECQWLSTWIEERVGENHATPKAKTIGRSLGTEYALLKARSNAANQNSKI